MTTLDEAFDEESTWERWHRQDHNDRHVYLSQSRWDHITHRRLDEPDGPFEQMGALQVFEEDMQVAIGDANLCHKSFHSDPPRFGGMKWDYYACSTDEYFAGHLVHVPVERLVDGGYILTAFVRPEVRREACWPFADREVDERSHRQVRQPCGNRGALPPHGN